MARVSLTLWSVSRMPESLSPEGEDNLLDVVDGDGVYAAEWLVQKKKVRQDCEAPGDLHPAALSSAEGIAGNVGDLLEAKILYQPVHHVPGRLFGGRVLLEDQLKVLPHREVPEDGRLLGEIANAETGPAVDRQGRQFPGIDRHRSRIGLDKPDDHVECGGFSRTVRTEQPDDLAHVDVEVNFRNHRAAPVGLAEGPGGYRLAHFDPSILKISLGLPEASTRFRSGKNIRVSDFRDLAAWRAVTPPDTTRVPLAFE